MHICSVSIQNEIMFVPLLLIIYRPSPANTSSFAPASQSDSGILSSNNGLQITERETPSNNQTPENDHGQLHMNAHHNSLPVPEYSLLPSVQS